MLGAYSATSCMPSIARRVTSVRRPTRRPALWFPKVPWRRLYGGPKWARIAETLRDLISALDAGDLVAASRISDSVSFLHHNSGPLVPTRLAWEVQPYLREKWPELCD